MQHGGPSLHLSPMPPSTATQTAPSPAPVLLLNQITQILSPYEPAVQREALKLWRAYVAKSPTPPDPYELFDVLDVVSMADESTEATYDVAPLSGPVPGKGYAPEARERALALADELDNASEAARRLGIPVNRIYRWQKKERTVTTRPASAPDRAPVAADRRTIEALKRAVVALVEAL